MYTCHECGFAVDTAAVPLPSRCPRCGTSTNDSTAQPSESSSQSGLSSLSGLSGRSEHSSHSSGLRSRENLNLGLSGAANRGPAPAASSRSMTPTGGRAASGGAPPPPPNFSPVSNRGPAKTLFGMPDTGLAGLAPVSKKGGTLAGAATGSAALKTPSPVASGSRLQLPGRPMPAASPGSEELQQNELIDLPACAEALDRIEESFIDDDDDEPDLPQLVDDRPSPNFEALSDDDDLALPAPISAFGSAELPAPTESGDLDLPALREEYDDYLQPVDDDGLVAPAYSNDLLEPTSLVDLPESSDNLDLPMPSDNLDLPVPSENVGLPTPVEISGVPTPVSNAASAPTPAGSATNSKRNRKTPPPIPIPRSGPKGLGKKKPPPPPKQKASEAKSGGLDDLGLSDLDELGDDDLSAGHIDNRPSSDGNALGISDLDLDMGFGPGAGLGSGDGHPSSMSASASADHSYDQEYSGEAASSILPESLRSSSAQESAEKSSLSLPISELPLPNMSSPAPRKVARPPLPRAVKFGIGGVVLVGGLAGTLWALGLFAPAMGENGQERGVAGSEEFQKRLAAGQAGERSEAILKKFAEDSPEAYQEALALAEENGDFAGQAEAALLSHYRYGPDHVLLGQAEGWMEVYEENPKAYVQRVFGLRALAKGDLAEARKRLDGVDTQSLLYRAWLELEENQAHEAMKLLKRATSENSKHLAVALTSHIAAADLAPNGNNELKQLEQFALRHPKYFQAKLERAEALLEEGFLVEAAKVSDALQPPRGTGPGLLARIRLMQGEARMRQGNFGPALRLVKQARDLQPSSAQLRIAHIRALLRVSDRVSAGTEIDMLLRDHGKEIPVQKLAAEVKIERGEGDDALAILDQLESALPGDPSIGFLRGQVHAMRFRVEKAQEQFLKVRRKDPTMVKAILAEVDMLVRAEKIKEGLKLLEDQIDAIPRSKGRKIRKMASRLYRKQAELFQLQAQEKGKTDRNSAGIKAAWAALQQAQSHDINDNKTRLMIGVLGLETGQRQAAEQEITELYERTGGFPGLTEPLSDIYLRRGQLDQLEKLIGSQLEQEHALDDILLSGALLRLGQKRVAEADELTTRVIHRSPANWRAHLIKAQVLVAQELYNDAMVEIEQARPKKPRAEVELWTGKILELTGDPKKSSGHYVRALKIDPTLTEAAVLRARLMVNRGEAKKAVAVLEPIVAETSDFPVAYVALGRARSDLGQKTAAIREFRRAYKLDPKLFEAYYFEGRIHSDRNEHDAAISALQRALDVSDDGQEQNYVLDCYRRLGHALRMRRRSGEARKFFKRYLQIAPKNAVGRAEVLRELRKL